MKRILLILLLITAFTALFSQTKNPNDDGRQIRIPVVFHVIYANSSQNIPDSLIDVELHDLNEDFNARNNMALLDNDFRNLVGNANIEFYRLDTSLSISSEKGVRRISKKNGIRRGELLIDEENCVNVYIANHDNESVPNMVNLYFRDIGTHSHVMTHETGHWLGLYHIFGPLKNTARWRVRFQSNDDEIEDTPEQVGATATCYRNGPQCPCPPLNITYDNHKTLYNNFMDYSPCRCMFTVRQCIAMRNNIIENKKALFKSK